MIAREGRQEGLHNVEKRIAQRHVFFSRFASSSTQMPPQALRPKFHHRTCYPYTHHRPHYSFTLTPPSLFLPMFPNTTTGLVSNGYPLAHSRLQTIPLWCHKSRQTCLPHKYPQVLFGWSPQQTPQATILDVHQCSAYLKQIEDNWFFSYIYFIYNSRLR